MAGDEVENESDGCWIFSPTTLGDVVANWGSNWVDDDDSLVGLVDSKEVFADWGTGIVIILGEDWWCTGFTDSFVLVGTFGDCEGGGLKGGSDEEDVVFGRAGRMILVISGFIGTLGDVEGFVVSAETEIVFWDSAIEGGNWGGKVTGGTFESEEGADDAKGNDVVAAGASFSIPKSSKSNYRERFFAVYLC